MAVPNIFANVTTSIPLSQLDQNFATAITLGNTAVYLGNITTTLGNLTLTNVTLASGTSNLASTSISNGTSNVSITSSGGNVVVSTNNATAITVDTGQRTKFPTTIGVGAATPSTSGSGITFPATQSASSEANTLDDYEEGTWTPTIVGGYTGVTYNSQGGWYTKVGRSVVISGRANFNGTANAGQVSVGGLPFSQGNIGNGAYGGGGVPYTNLPVITNTSPYCSGSTVEYYAMGTGTQIVSIANASSNWISFVITISTD